MKLKKFLVLAFLLLLSFTPQAYAAQSLLDELWKLDGVVSVDEIVQSIDVFKEKYIVWFEQPIDWKNPSLGSFDQRVEIGFQGWDNVNVACASGYELDDKYFASDDRRELVKMYNGNFIKFEYRFFRESRPEGLSDDKPALWNYLTNENASYDFHNIMEQLRGILSGTWIFTGESKGGITTNVFSHFFPNDADAYVSYVAPFCDTPNDMRLVDAVFTTIGDERYGAVQAKAYRDIMLNYMVEVIKHRDYIQPRYFNLISDDAVLPQASIDVLVSPDRAHSNDVGFEAGLVHLVVGVWQYTDAFASFDEVLKMPHSTSADEIAYCQALLSLYRDNDDNETNDDNNSSEGNEGDEGGNDSKAAAAGRTYTREELMYPYTVQVEMELGGYGVTLKYLREALMRYGITLKATDEEASMSPVHPDVLKTITYDPSLRRAMLNWTHTTQSNVMMIYGNSDPWYFVRLPDVTDNPNVHIFVVDGNHGAGIEGMTSADKAAATELLNTWLTSYPVDPVDPVDPVKSDDKKPGSGDKKPEPSDPTDPTTGGGVKVAGGTSGGCSSGFGVYGVMAAMFLAFRRKSVK